MLSQSAGYKRLCNLLHARDPFLPFEQTMELIHVNNQLDALF